MTNTKQEQNRAGNIDQYARYLLNLPRVEQIRALGLKGMIGLVNDNRIALNDKERRVLASSKSMLRNLSEAGGRIGGESGISGKGLNIAHSWATKTIMKYGFFE